MSTSDKRIYPAIYKSDKPVFANPAGMMLTAARATLVPGTRNVLDIFTTKRHESTGPGLVQIDQYVCRATVDFDNGLMIYVPPGDSTLPLITNLLIALCHRLERHDDGGALSNHFVEPLDFVF